MSRPRTDKKSTLSPQLWESWSDEQILQTRVRDLGLDLAHSPLAEPIQQLYAELADRCLAFRPPCYLADEWFCPDKVPVIGIPFCLAHPRLKAIEQTMMYEVEGGTPETCMRLLRHECGHALNYAYRLFAKTRWRELFGPFSSRYSTNYSFQPYSKRYVVHLADNYAQAHPDEDFAETFAVWLTPDSDWEDAYADWPAIRKLRYVDNVMKGLRGKPPVNTDRDMPYAAARMTSTLAAHYERKRRLLGTDFPGYYDQALQRLFRTGRPHDQALKASTFLRRYQRRIVRGVTAWAGQRRYDVHRLIDKLIKRCDALDLYIDQPQTEAVLEVTAFVAVVATGAHRVQIEEKRT
jgi:hypothetical protein